MNTEEQKNLPQHTANKVRLAVSLCINSTVTTKEQLKIFKILKDKNVTMSTQNTGHTASPLEPSQV